MTGASHGPVLVAGMLEQVTSIIYRATGMTFSENKRYYIERRIAERMRCTHVADIQRYLTLIERDVFERQMLVNAVTINETYFYREDYQLKALSEEILPQIARTKSPGDLIRIWSMPCSTGEEAYSIALWLLENWSLVDAYHIEIVGSDVDTQALASARDGRFGRRALAKLPAQLANTYFEPELDHQRRIVEDLRESVLFTQANIIDRPSVRAQGLFDVILCRNLLIYFDDTSRKTAADHLHDALVEEGYLLLGHSESMARIDERFDVVRLRDAIVYRRS